MGFSKKIPYLRILVIQPNSFSEKDQTIVGVTRIQSYNSKTKPWISILRSKFYSFLVILTGHYNLAHLFVTFSKICHCLKAFRLVLEIFVINRYSFSIPLKITENIPFIKNGKCILRVNSQCVVISFHSFIV